MVNPRSGYRAVIPAHIGLVTLGVRDLAVAADFYERLGWPRRGEAASGVVLFETAGARLALYPLDELARSLPDAALPTPGQFRGSALVVNIDGADAVDDACETARRAGATIVAEPHPTEWGGRVCLFADPDGNLWELLGRDSHR
jgi:catechol 2,3-dioxygenase-like lactoylglutathione lyase family enzyme